MIVPILRVAGSKALGFLRSTALFGTGATVGGVIITGSQGKDSGLQNWLTNALSTVMTSTAEAESEARWQTMYKSLYKGIELLKDLGLDEALENVLRMVGVNIEFDDLQEKFGNRLVEDTTSDLGGSDTSLTDTFESVRDTVGTRVDNVLNTLSESFSEAAEVVQEGIGTAKSALGNAFESVVEGVQEFGRDTFTGSDYPSSSIRRHQSLRW